MSADDIIFSYRQLIDRAREQRLKIYGGTLTPFEDTTFPATSPLPEKQSARP